MNEVTIVPRVVEHSSSTFCEEKRTAFFLLLARRDDDGDTSGASSAVAPSALTDFGASTLFEHSDRPRAEPFESLLVL